MIHLKRIPLCEGLIVSQGNDLHNVDLLLVDLLLDSIHHIITNEGIPHTNAHICMVIMTTHHIIMAIMVVINPPNIKWTVYIA